MSFCNQRRLDRVWDFWMRDIARHVPARACSTTRYSFALCVAGDTPQSRMAISIQQRGRMICGTPRTFSAGNAGGAPTAPDQELCGISQSK
jgi:hypothetical protein